MPNFKLAFRTLFRSPFVTSVAALSLALGIGANAAIFSLFNEMLMQPLPVPSAARLVNLEAPGPKPGSQSCSSAGGCDVVFSYPMYRDIEKAQSVRLMILRQVAVLTLIGGSIGVASGMAAGKGAATLLYEVKAFDPVVFAVSTGLLMLVSLGAGYIPAMRASRIDLIRALRYE